MDGGYGYGGTPLGLSPGLGQDIPGRGTDRENDRDHHSPRPLRVLGVSRKREKKGECPTCGTKTHNVHPITRKKTPIKRVEGKVIAGRCLICNPVEGYMTRPEGQPGPTRPPQVINASPSRGVTPSDDNYTVISGLTMDQTIMRGPFGAQARMAAGMTGIAVKEHPGSNSNPAPAREANIRQQMTRNSSRMLMDRTIGESDRDLGGFDIGRSSSLSERISSHSDQKYERELGLMDRISESARANSMQDQNSGSDFNQSNSGSITSDYGKDQLNQISPKSQRRPRDETIEMMQNGDSQRSMSESLHSGTSHGRASKTGERKYPPDFGGGNNGPRRAPFDPTGDAERSPMPLRDDVRRGDRRKSPSGVPPSLCITPHEASGFPCLPVLDAPQRPVQETYVPDTGNAHTQHGETHGVFLQSQKEGSIEAVHKSVTIDDYSKSPSEPSQSKRQESVSSKLARQWREESLKRLTEEEFSLQLMEEVNLKSPPSDSNTESETEKDNFIGRSHPAGDAPSKHSFEQEEKVEIEEKGDLYQASFASEYKISPTKEKFVGEGRSHGHESSSLDSNNDNSGPPPFSAGSQSQIQHGAHGQNTGLENRPPTKHRTGNKDEAVPMDGQNAPLSNEAEMKKRLSSRTLSEITSSSGGGGGSDNTRQNKPSISDIPTILKCLKMYHNNHSVHEKAYEALYELATLSDPRGKSSIITNGGTDAIVEGIWANMDVPKVQVSALYALWALAASDDVAKTNGAMVRSNAAGVIESILISMQQHEKDASVQLAGCGVLSCLASTAAQTNDGDDGTLSGAMFTVMNAMRIHTKCQDVQEWGIRALYNECCNSDANKTRFVADNDYGVDGLELVHNLLTNFSSDFPIMEWACRLSFCISSNEMVAEKMSSSVELIDAIVSAMKNNEKRLEAASLVQAACGAMGNLAVSVETNCISIRSAGGIDAILDALMFFESYENVCVKACAALSALAANAQCRVTIFKLGGVKRVLSSMDKFPHNALLQEEACRALSFLCIDSVDAKEAMSNDAAVSAIVRAMESHQDSEGVQEAGCGLLATLSVDLSHQRSIFVSTCAVEAISNAMTHLASGPNHMILHEVCTFALRNLSANTSNHNAILSSGAVNATIQTTRAYAESERVQENACILVWNLEATDDSVSVINAGEMEFIILAMRNHPGSAKVQEVACGALWSIVACSDEMKEAVADLSGVEPVMCSIMLYMHESEIGVLEKACGVLSSLSTHYRHARAIVDFQGISAIIGAMRNHIESVVLLEYGCLLLRNLAAFDTNYAEEASSSCSTILRGMREHPDASGLQREACGALWSLAAQSETCKERILFSDGVDVITKAMQQHRTDTNLQHEARGAMSQLV